MAYANWSANAQNQIAQSNRFFDQGVLQNIQDKGRDELTYAGQNWKALGSLISPDSPAWQIVKIKQDEARQKEEVKISQEEMEDRLEGRVVDSPDAVEKQEEKQEELVQEASDRSFIASSANQQGFDYTTVDAIRKSTGHRKVILTERYVKNFYSTTIPRVWAEARQSDTRQLQGPDGVFRINDPNLSPIQYAMAQRFITAEQFKKSGIGNLNPLFLSSKNVDFFTKLAGTERTAYQSYKKNWEIKQQGLARQEAIEAFDADRKLAPLMSTFLSEKDKNGKARTFSESLDNLEEWLEEVAEADAQLADSYLESIKGQKYIKTNGDEGVIGDTRIKRLGALIDVKRTEQLNKKYELAGIEHKVNETAYVNGYKIGDDGSKIPYTKKDYQADDDKLREEQNLPKRVAPGIIRLKYAKVGNPADNKLVLQEMERSGYRFSEADLSGPLVHADNYEWVKNKINSNNEKYDTRKERGYKTNLEGVKSLLGASIDGWAPGSNRQFLSTKAQPFLDLMQDDYDAEYDRIVKSGEASPSNAAIQALEHVKTLHGWKDGNTSWNPDVDSKYGRQVAEIQRQARKKGGVDTFFTDGYKTTTAFIKQAGDNFVDAKLDDATIGSLIPFEAELRKAAVGKGTSDLGAKLYFEEFLPVTNNEGVRVNFGVSKKDFYKILVNKLRGEIIKDRPGEKKAKEDLSKLCSSGTELGRKAQRLVERGWKSDAVQFLIERDMIRNPNACNDPSVTLIQF